ncbi:E3 ubiquitin-protein ligase TRIM39-like [Hyperolius riggenbachi]|uniref:E3 ubiquitin-protein ligase TRIM39-like n=1 Tax=Hyperolius riggenbachi TaxID=752182 RepID=UPI0035A26BB6
MASAPSNPVKDLQEELTCSICLDHYNDPVSIDCGHCYCRNCISQTWKGIRSNFPCPQCRHVSRWKFLRTVRPLENVLEISNRLVSSAAKEQTKNQCKKHKEPLKLYCKVDGKEICVICRESVAHRTHTVMPMEETTKEFQADLEERLTSLRKDAANIARSKAEEEAKAVKFEDEILQKVKMVTSESEALRQLLADQEKQAINRLENMRKQVCERRNESIARLNAKLSAVNKTIDDLQKGQLLEWKISTLSLSSGGGDALRSYGVPLDVKKHHYRPPEGSQSKSRSQDWLCPTMELLKSIAVSLSFDPKTANKNIVVAYNQKSIRYTEDPAHPSPCPERFDSKPCVFATTGFRSGRHYWEVDVGGGIYWTVGVASQSVQRKGKFRISPHDGIWAIGLLGMYTDRYVAFTSPDICLNPQERPEKIGIYLNCVDGMVSFYDAVHHEHLYTFDVDVHETMLPFFCVGALGTLLRLNDICDF